MSYERHSYRMPYLSIFILIIGLVDTLRKGKLMDVNGFELLHFDARLLAEDHWLEVHTKQGDGPDDEWVEILGGGKGKNGRHHHTGINKDATIRFVKKRGVLKATSQIAENAITHELLDATKEHSDERRFVTEVGLSSNRISKKVWLSKIQLLRRDQTAEFG